MAEYECWYRRYKMEIINSYKKRAFINMTEKIRKFEPTFLHSQFNKKLPKKPQRIFVGSMSEIYYWEKEWMEMVIEKIKEYPQHTFIFLTKNPIVYCKYIFPANCWLGETITNNEDAYYYDEIYLNQNDFRTKFVCIEPILQDINPYFFKKAIDWVIVGAETGSRKDKIIVNERWIINIINACRKYSIPVYLKNSITNKFTWLKKYKLFPNEKEGGYLIKQGPYLEDLKKDLVKGGE